jgi:DNA-binding transcriptional LysR family regulator
MHLDLLSIALFIRVCETQNLSFSGREFDLSPAASSNRISELERMIGARLFHRTTRKISLSQEGESFLPHARQLLEVAQTAKDSVAGANLAPSGLLRVACSASFGRQHITPAIPEFLELFPKVDIDLRLSDAVIDMTSNAIDVAMCHVLLPIVYQRQWGLGRLGPS